MIIIIVSLSLLIDTTRAIWLQQRAHSSSHGGWMDTLYLIINIAADRHRRLYMVRDALYKAYQQ